MDECEGRRALEAQHDRALSSKMRIEEPDRQLCGGIGGGIENPAGRPWNEGFGHQHHFLQPIFQLTQLLPVGFADLGATGKGGELEEDLVDPAAHAFERAQQVAPPIVRQEHSSHQMPEEHRNDGADRHIRQLGKRRPEIRPHEIGGKGEHADRKTARPEHAARRCERDHHQEDEIGEKTAILEARRDGDDAEACDATEEPRHQLSRIALVANRHPALDRQDDAKTESRRRQRHDEYLMARRTKKEKTIVSVTREAMRRRESAGSLASSQSRN